MTKAEAIKKFIKAKLPYYTENERGELVDNHTDGGSSRYIFFTTTFLFKIKSADGVRGILRKHDIDKVYGLLEPEFQTATE